MCIGCDIKQILNQSKSLRSYNISRFSNLTQTFRKEKEKKIFLFRDDITKTWKQLSLMGRVVRVTSISLKLCVIVMGILVLIIASYSLGSYLFVLEVPVINMSLEIIKNDQECKRLLGDDIKVLSRSLWSYIRLDSYIPSQKILELNGREQLIMQFLVKGKIAQGEVHLEMTRAPKERFQYQFLYLDVIDSDNLLHRVWLVNSNKVKNQSEKREFFLNLWGLR